MPDQDLPSASSTPPSAEPPPSTPPAKPATWPTFAAGGISFAVLIVLIFISEFDVWRHPFWLRFAVAMSLFFVLQRVFETKTTRRPDAIRERRY